MNKYYFDFFKEKLKKDIIHELLEEGISKELLIQEVTLYFEGNIQFENIQKGIVNKILWITLSLI